MFKGQNQLPLLGVGNIIQGNVKVPAAQTFIGNIRGKHHFFRRRIICVFAFNAGGNVIATGQHDGVQRVIQNVRRRIEKSQ